MSLLVIGITFLSMAAVGVLIWRLVQNQEVNDPRFESKLKADERRAKANRSRAAELRHDASSRAAAPTASDPDNSSPSP
jgi:hypothetical protein